MDPGMYKQKRGCQAEGEKSVEGNNFFEVQQRGLLLFLLYIPGCETGSSFM